MCGIAGLWDLRKPSASALEHSAEGMATALKHRGPDDAGVYTDARAGVALSHRRLSIIDLSAAGHQPMVSASKRFALSYNGELYNYLDLRKELESEGVRFRTQTDSEVMLEALATWGVTDALRRFNGMFAFALWDKQERRLYLARDPFGIKPLYVGGVDGVLAFGSELKAIRALSRTKLVLDRSALTEYFRFGFVPAPLSIYQGINKVMPGTVRVFFETDSTHPEGFSAASAFDLAGFSGGEFAYWSLQDEYIRGVGKQTKMSFSNAVDELETILTRAVRRQRVADVPVGAFLSGGVDSSTVVALLQKKDKMPVRTFTIGVEDPRLNEAQAAQRIALALGTQHTELMISEKEILDTVPRMGRVYDEPFADSSQIPTLLVSQLAAREVKVVLSGDGGDELFGGYNRHIHGVALWRAFQKLPAAAREAFNELNSSAIAASLDGVLEWTLGRVFKEMKHRTFANVREKMANVSESETIADLYRNLITHVRDAARYVDGIEAGKRQASVGELDELRNLMLMDGTHYLPNDILMKVDRATMACSIEARVPLLDTEVVRFAARLPNNFLIQGNSGKRILRAVLKKHLPAALVDRPKMGFAVPIGDWLRGPLRTWATETLRTAANAHAGLLRWDLISADMNAFLEERSERAAWAWDAVQLAAWLNQHED